MAFITGKTLQGNCGEVLYKGDGRYVCGPIPDVPGVDPHATDHVNFYAKIEGEIGEVVHLDIQYPSFDESLCGFRKYRTAPFFTVAHRCVYVSCDELNWTRVEDVESDADNWTLHLHLTLTSTVFFVSVNYFYTVRMYRALQEAMSDAKFTEEKVIGLSRDGQKIYLYKVTDPSVPTEEKQIVYMQGAQHCCEFGGPHLLDALLRYLNSGTKEVQALLRKYEFHITPVVSVADWAAGNVNVLLADPNTIWDTLHTPEVKAIDSYLKSLDKKPALLLDLHNARRNIILIGDYLPAEQVEEQLRFAALLLERCDYISPVKTLLRRSEEKYALFSQYASTNFGCGMTIELSRFSLYDRATEQELPLSKALFERFAAQLPHTIDAFLSGEKASHQF